jgi:hypothetical protein
MSDITQILTAIEQGDVKAADKLLPLVYEELRRLAAKKMMLKSPGQWMISRMQNVCFVCISQ